MANNYDLHTPKFYEILSQVRTELFDDTTFYLGVAFSEKNRRTEVEHAVFDSFYDAIYWCDDKEALMEQGVHDYLFELLEEQDSNMKDTNYFDSEEEALAQGYYWFYDLEKWLKINFEVGK